ncbi:unnamed protein product [Dicrocoelium dendriticum]|nr:unnamed protein product [Dicrocoelium dendriticum]
MKFFQTLSLSLFVSVYFHLSSPQQAYSELFQISPQELVYELASTIAYGGNILINVGPTSWGTIGPIYEERLRQLGAWLRVNGESIYAAQTWTIQNDQGYIWYTSKSEPVIDASIPFWEPGNESAIHPFRVRPLFPQKLLRTVVYAIITQWRNGNAFSNKPRCVGDILLPSVTAHPVQSEFYLLTGKDYKKLDFRIPSPRQPGVLVAVPESILQVEQLHWGCVIKIVNPN